MFMALVIAFTMGPVVVARAENGKVEDKIINAIDMVDSCVRHPQICAHGAIGAIKSVLDDVNVSELANIIKVVAENCAGQSEVCASDVIDAIKAVLDEKVVSDVADILNQVKGYNYAPLFEDVFTDKAKKFVDDPKWADLLKLTNEDNVSFSQVCDGLKTLVKEVAAASSSNKDTKEEL